MTAISVNGALMSYAVLDQPEKEVVSAAVALLGSPLRAWLEDERRHDGLALIENLAAEAAVDEVAAWPQGRIFGDVGELRWARRPDGRINLVLIGDGLTNEQLPLAFRGSDNDARVRKLVPLIDQDETILFWGELRRGRWEDGRIPAMDRFILETWKHAGRRFPYVGLRIRAYIDDWPEQDSTRMPVRYCAFVADYTPEQIAEEQPDDTV